MKTTTYKLSPYYFNNGYWVDTDPRPKTTVCPSCARDIVAGARCICVPSSRRDNRPVTAK